MEDIVISTSSDNYVTIPGPAIVTVKDMVT